MGVTAMNWYRFECDTCGSQTRPVCAPNLAEAAEHLPTWDITTSPMHYLGPQVPYSTPSTYVLDSVHCPDCRPQIEEAADA